MQNTRDVFQIRRLFEIQIFEILHLAYPTLLLWVFYYNNKNKTSKNKALFAIRVPQQVMHDMIWRKN